MEMEGVAVVGDSDGVGMGGWRHFGRPSVVVGGWKTSRVVFVEVFVIHFIWFSRIVEPYKLNIYGFCKA